MLAWEADRILSYRLVPIKEGDNDLSWMVEGAQFPNFTLTAAGMSGQRLDQASLDVRVERDLRVTITPTKKQVGPGEAVEVEVTTVDQLGRPVAAEVGLALVDRSLLRLFADKLPPIGPFFYDQTRTGVFATTATNTFSYHPDTRPVSGAVVEEADRLAAIARNQAGRGAVLDEARRRSLVAKGDYELGLPFVNGTGNIFSQIQTFNAIPVDPQASGMGRMGRGGSVADKRVLKYGNVDDKEMAGDLSDRKSRAFAPGMFIDKLRQRR